MSMDIKAFFVDELKRSYSERIAGAARAESEANEEADLVRSDARRREDAKGAVLQGRLAKGHRRRPLCYGRPHCQPTQCLYPGAGHHGNLCDAW